MTYRPHKMGDHSDDFEDTRPCDCDRPVEMTDTFKTIERIAELAEAVGFQAGVGGSETAGMIVSYLAKHPEQIETVLRDGIIDLPDNWWRHGRLTWQGMNGKVIDPQQSRLRAIVRRLLDSDDCKPKEG